MIRFKKHNFYFISLIFLIPHLLLPMKINFKDRVNSELLKAVYSGNLAKVKEFLALGADINAKDCWDATALIHAATSGHIEIAKELLIRGANVNAYDAGGNTALIQACRYNQTDIALELLSCGAKVAVADEFGITALTCAKSWGDTKVSQAIKQVKVLHKDLHILKVELSKGNIPPYQALLCGIDTGNWIIVKYLLDNFKFDLFRLEQLLILTKNNCLTLQEFSDESRIDLIKNYKKIGRLLLDHINMITLLSRNIEDLQKLGPSSNIPTDVTATIATLAR